MKKIEFVQLPEPRKRKLMRDVWLGALGAIREATLIDYPLVAVTARPWVCVYAEGESSEYTPLLTHEDVNNGAQRYYDPRTSGGSEVRPCESVRGAIRAQLSLADATNEFEVIIRNRTVFSRYIGD